MGLRPQLTSLVLTACLLVAAPALAADSGEDPPPSNPVTGGGSIDENGDIDLFGGKEERDSDGPTGGGTSREFVPYIDWETNDIYFDQGTCADGWLRGVRGYYRYTSPTTKTLLYEANGCVPDPRSGPYTPGSIDEVDVREVLTGQLPVPSVARNPVAEGLVQLETYLWYEGGALESVVLPSGATCDGYSMNASRGGITLEAWVCVDQYSWDMGNGDVVRADRPGSESQPAAEYVYEQTGTYDLVASTRWVGNWRVSVEGFAPVSGTFGAPIVMSSNPEPFTVYQVRAVPKTRD